MINLNNPVKFTLDDIEKLIASKNDSEDRQLRVSTSGCAYLSDIVAAVDIEDLAFRFETWDARTDNVGIKASQRKEWVSRIYKALDENWQDQTKSYIDNY